MIVFEPIYFSLFFVYNACWYPWLRPEDRSLLPWGGGDNIMVFAYKSVFVDSAMSASAMLVLLGAAGTCFLRARMVFCYI